MNYCIFKLEFLTPVHFGASDSARSLESAGMTLCADTIFSALCHEAQRAGGLVELIHAARSGGLLLSDAMPFCGEEFYIPKPALPATKHADSDPSLRKRMKKLRYLPLSLLPGFIDSLRGGAAFDPAPVRTGFGESFANEKVSIAREADPATGGAKDAEPFSVGAFRFEDGCGLYFIAAFTSREIMESVARLIRLLESEGIGGKISAGFGKFRLAEKILLDGSEPEPLKPLEAMLRENAASHYILLTSALPRDDELAPAMENAQYTLIRRAGFVQSDCISNPVKKRTQYFFAAGSVFGQTFEGGLCDVGIDMPHPVYRYAKPIFLGVNV